MYSSSPSVGDKPPALAPEPAGLRPFSQVAAVFLCGACAFLELYCTQPLLPLLSRMFKASEASVSMTISASTLGVAVSSALLAVFAERVNRKRMITGSMAALAVVTLLTATAPSLNALVVWRLLQGLLTPGVFIITIAYITEEWPGHLVPRVMSLYVAGTVLGGFTGRIAGGLLSEHYNWRLMFLVLGVAGGIGALLTRRILPEGKPRMVLNRTESRFAPVVASLRNRRLLATFAIGFCMLFTLVAAFSYITFYLADAPFHLSTEELSWLFAVYLVGLLATLAAGTVLARIGLRHGMLAAIGCCIAGTLLTLWPSLAAVAIGLAFASSGVFIAQTCANSFLRDAAPEGSRVSAAGIYICSYYVGGTAGGVVPGLFWKMAGWPGCVAVICALLLVAACAAWFGWRPKAQERDAIAV